jgi:hypothetical protein
MQTDSGIVLHIGEDACYHFRSCGREVAEQC